MREELIKLAKALDEAKTLYEALGMLQIPTNPEERAEQELDYHLAREHYFNVWLEFRKAIANELPTASKKGLT